MGTGRPLPVCVSVSSSKVSSRVPKPPGRQTKALDSLMSISFRVKKYFIAHVLVVAGDDGVGGLLEGQPDGNADRLLPPGALHARRP